MATSDKDSKRKSMMIKLIVILVIVFIVGFGILGVVAYTKKHKQQEVPPESKYEDITAPNEAGVIDAVNENPADKYAEIGEETIEQTLRKFLTMIKNKDFELAFDYVYQPEKCALRRSDDFSWFIMKSPLGRLKDDDTTVLKLEAELDGEIRTVDLELNVASEKVKYKIRGKLDAENKWKFLVDDLYAYDWELAVPKGVKIHYNEVDLTSYIKSTSMSWDIYSFPIVPLRETTFVMSSLFGEYSVDITPVSRTSIKPKDYKPQELLVELEGNALDDALAGALSVINSLNTAMSTNADIEFIRPIVDKRIVLNSLSEVYAIGVRQRDRYSSTGGTLISDVIQNETGKCYISGWDTVSLDVGMYMNMEDAKKGALEMRLFTDITLSNTDNQWQLYKANPKVFTYINPNTKDF